MSEENERAEARQVPAKPAKKKARPAEPKNFEEAMARLEEIVAKMESGAEDLASMVESFEEGRALLSYCNKTLSEIERKVEILASKADGSVEAVPFGEDGV